MKIGIFKIGATLLLSILVLSNCTIQERKYRKGFYVNIKHKVHEKAGQSKKEDGLDLIVINVKAEEELGCKQELVASIVKTTPPIPKTKLDKIAFATAETCGDVVVMTDGSAINAMVLEISETNIKYKKCNNIEGPIYNLKIEYVNRIEYANGKKEIIHHNIHQKNIHSSSENYHTNTVSQNKPFNSMAIASLVMGIITFSGFLAVITAPLAFIFGLIAKKQLREENGSRGNGMASFGIAIGAIVLFILLLLLFGIFI